MGREETQNPTDILHSREDVYKQRGQTVRQARSWAFSEATSLGDRSLDHVSEKEDFSLGPTVGAQ